MVGDAILASANMQPLPSRRDRFSEWSDRHFKWLLVAPAVLLILALSVYPLLFSLWVLFVNYDFQIPGHAFVGLKNFQQVFADPVARWSLWLTIMFSVINVTIEFLLGLALALAMTKTFRGRGIVMSLLIILLPLTVWTLAIIFVLGGVYVAIEETLEDSFCAELVGEEHHGIPPGTSDRSEPAAGRSWPFH